MNEYKTIIEERPYNLNPINIEVVGHLQIKDNRVFGFSNDSYMRIPYVLKKDFNEFLATITFKRLMGTQQNILLPESEKNSLKPIFISKDNKLHYGEYVFDKIFNKTKEYTIFVILTNNQIKIKIQEDSEEIEYLPLDNEINEDLSFIVGKGDDRFSSYCLSKSYFKLDGRTVWFGGLNTLSFNGEIINLGYIHNDGLLIIDEIKLVEPYLIKVSNDIPTDSYCYWFDAKNKEFWLCSSGQKVKKLSLPKFRVISNGLSVKSIEKYYESNESSIRAIKGIE